MVEPGFENRLFLSTLSLRRATRETTSIKPVFGISIHALLAESDPAERHASSQQEISIHALLAESDSVLWMALNRLLRFLSTLSLRRATSLLALLICLPRDFYPRSPCGERHLDAREPHYVCHFYPRSPCGERRGDLLNFFGRIIFLSTLSLRRATYHTYPYLSILF